MHNYHNLKIWKESIDFVEHIYAMTKNFPQEESYGIKAQIRRAAVSIPSNIAEGTSRNSDKDFNRFLEIALGSAFETQTQLLIANKLNYLAKDDHEILESQLGSIIRQMQKFRKRLLMKKGLRMKI